MPTWVIIGASRGIGYQYLTTLSRDPSNTVIGIVRNPSPTQEKVTADKLSNVHILPGDLTDSASLYAAAKQVAGLTNAVDYLVVNGGYQSKPTQPLVAGDYIGAEKEALLLSELDTSIRTNAIGALYSINAFMPLILKSEIKKVVTISSGAADQDIHVTCGLDGQLPYAMSKAALNMITAKFAAQYKKDGVKFLALGLGYVLTLADSLENIPPQLAPLFESRTVQLRALNPDLKGPIPMKEGVDLQLKVIEELTLEQSGQFLSQYGNKQWV